MNALTDDTPKAVRAAVPAAPAAAAATLHCIIVFLAEANPDDIFFESAVNHTVNVPNPDAILITFV